MEPQEISIETLGEKYAKNGETTILEIQQRVADALAAVEKKPEEWSPIFLEAQENGFIAGGRINSAAGLDNRSTLINCFLQPVGDCITGVDNNGYPAIYTALAEAAETMRRGGGVGYDFSRIRPLGAMVKGTQSRASGPLSYMRVFDRSCETVESAGARRGAQMGVLRCDHPDISSFISAKDIKGEFNNFNLSIGVTDAFMTAVIENSTWDLVHKVAPSEEYIAENNSYYDDNRGVWVWKTIPISDIWEKVMRSTYDHAEPGILFLDKMNQENNLYYCEVIEATNPCAEQPLPPYGCCDLGSINLTRFISNPFADDAVFDYDLYKQTIRTSVRMLDNVLDATSWPLEQQHTEAMNKRRVGLGFLGIGDAIIMMNKNYHLPDGVEFARNIAEVLRDTAYEASSMLAAEKGSFPLFDAKKFLAGKFAKRLPERIKRLIRKHGLRNSHLLSIAPTGTIALAFADNASNGIEPPFSWTYMRKKRMMDGTSKEYEVADYAWRLYREMGGDVNNLPSNFITALGMSVNAHVDVMKAVQPYLDTSISKTVNIPADYPYEKFKDLYIYAWKSGLKGLATYRPNDTLGSVLSEIKPETSIEKQTAVLPINSGEEYDIFLNKVIHQLPNDEYMARRKRIDYHGPEGKDNFYILVSFDQKVFIHEGKEVLVERPVEVFIETNPDNVPSEWVDSLSRNLSLLARSGLNLFCKALDNCKKAKSDKGKYRYGWITKEDGTKVPRYHASQIDCIGFAVKEILYSRNVIDDAGKPYRFDKLVKLQHGIEEVISVDELKTNSTIVYGKTCKECGASAVIKVDGCEKCTNCGRIGECG